MVYLRHESGAQELAEAEPALALVAACHTLTAMAYVCWMDDGSKHVTYCNSYYLRWYVRNSSRLHRIGGPAAEEAGDYAFYVRGELHRSDGPARVSKYERLWLLQGRQHRIEGPAFFTPYDPDVSSWHIDDDRVEPRSWKRRGRRLRWLLLATL